MNLTAEQFRDSMRRRIGEWARDHLEDLIVSALQQMGGRTQADVVEWAKWLHKRASGAA